MTSRFLGACAACILSLCATAQALAATVSGTLQSSDQHGYIQLDFTCAAGTTCNGTYKGVEYNIKCGVTHRFNGSITLQGLDPSKPSSSGSATVTQLQGTNEAACSVGVLTLNSTYTASSDGTNGTVSVSFGTTPPLQGTFSLAGAPNNVRVSGSLTTASNPDFSFTIAFSCSGNPCAGVYTRTGKDTGCSNGYAHSDTFLASGFDLSHPAALAGNVTVYGLTQSQPHPDGTCSYSFDTTPANLPYTAAWDGTNGTMTATATSQATGTHVPLNGSFSGAGATPPPTFPMTVTTNITPTTSTVTATIQPRPQDAGTTQSVFVFAYAPQSLLAGKAFKDGPDPCVLAQVGANGQLVGATAATLAPVVTGVLNSQGTLVNILNNVSTPNVSGASLYVGYGPNPGGMFTSGTYQGVVNIPGAAQCQTNLATAATPATPGALTGLWWNASESGWGVHFTQRGANLFAAWYTYDSAGNPKWYVSTCSGIAGQGGTCNGTLFEVTGPSFFGGTFNPALVNATNAGPLTVTFSNANAASMSYTVAGVTRTIALTRQPLGGGTATPAVDFSDIWWGGASESGWGMAMAQQSGITFLAWYVYDSGGKPTWLVATCIMSGSSCTGSLYRTTGPAFGPAFDANAVHATAAGTILVVFTDANNAVINYTVDGVSATKALTRQLF